MDSKKIGNDNFEKLMMFFLSFFLSVTNMVSHSASA